jgi:anti-anti-sigma regulatory factor
MEKDFDVKKNGSTLVIELVNELSADNAPLLIEEMSKYANQDIQEKRIIVT